MKPPSDADLLAFLTGGLDGPDRDAVLTWVEGSPEGAAELRAAARGLAAAERWGLGVRHESDPPGVPSAAPAPQRRAALRRPGLGSRRVPAWALPLTVAATLALTIPFVGDRNAGTAGSPTMEPAEALRFAGAPVDPRPSFVLVLHGRWPDAGSVSPEERRRRADEYWAWTGELARRGLLVAAGDLRWEPGLRVVDAERWNTAEEGTVADPGFLVGMFALRADSYEEALAIARNSPHLTYGGTISVRRVGGGFVTVPGMGDWSD